MENNNSTCTNFTVQVNIVNEIDSVLLDHVSKWSSILLIWNIPTLSDCYLSMSILMSINKYQWVSLSIVEYTYTIIRASIPLSCHYPVIFYPVLLVYVLLLSCSFVVCSLISVLQLQLTFKATTFFIHYFTSRRTEYYIHMIYLRTYTYIQWHMRATYM